MSDKVLAVTGANGFVGRRLIEHFERRGWTARALVRRPAAGQFRCDLPDEIDSTAFAGARVVVHAAYATRPGSPAEARRTNEEGTLRVLRAARSAAVKRFVFISSTAAHEQSETYYGRSKLRLEQRLDPGRDLILRCGLVLGRGGGLFDRLVVALRRLSLVPVFEGGRQKIQTVHIDDLCATLELALDRELCGCHVVAHPDATELRELFRGVARRLGRPCHLIPLPTAPVLVALRSAERIGLRLPFSSENVLAMRSMHTQQTSDAVRSLGVALRSTEQSLDDLLGAV